MARSFFTCPSCGESGEVYGRNRRDADYQAKRAEEAGRLCAACYARQLEAERAAENAAAAEATAQLGLPDLTGSPKQVAWATTLRDKGLPKLAAAVNTTIETIRQATKDPRVATVASDEELRAALREIEDGLRAWADEERQKTDSRHWIDRRDDRQDDRIRDLLRDTGWIERTCPTYASIVRKIRP